MVLDFDTRQQLDWILLDKTIDTLATICLNTKIMAEVLEVSMSEVLKGITFPIGVQVNTPAPVVGLFNVNDRADLAVAAYASLGAVTDKDAARKDYRARLQSLHDILAFEQRDRQDYPAIEPFIGLELPNDFAFGALVSAFDKKQSIDTYVLDELWCQYKASELNRRTLSKITPAINNTDGVRGEALAMLLGGNRDNEPGLYSTNQNLKTQKKAAKDQKKSYDATHERSELRIANPADYVIINAQRRENGEPLLDRGTLSHFIQLAMKAAIGGSCLPSANSFYSRLGWGETDGSADPRGGFRILVGQKPSRSSRL